MELTEAIKQVISRFGSDIISTRRFVYLIDDFGGFRFGSAPLKEIMLRMIDNGFGDIILNAAENRDEDWQSSIFNFIRDFTAESAYRKEHIVQVTATLLSGLGLLDGYLKYLSSSAPDYLKNDREQRGKIDMEPACKSEDGTPANKRTGRKPLKRRRLLFTGIITIGLVLIGACFLHIYNKNKTYSTDPETDCKIIECQEASATPLLHADTLLVDRLLMDIYNNNGNFSDSLKTELPQALDITPDDYWLNFIKRKIDAPSSSSRLTKRFNSYITVDEGTPIYKRGNDEDYHKLGSRPLKLGTYGSDVEMLVIKLSAAGYLNLDNYNAQPENGYIVYDNTIDKALKQFRRDAGIKDDTVISETLIKLLESWNPLRSTIHLGARDLDAALNMAGSDVDELVNLLIASGFPPQQKLLKKTRKTGPSGDELIYLMRLKSSKDYTALANATVHYIFTEDIKTALKAFQAFHALPPTGTLNPANPDNSP